MGFASAQNTAHLDSLLQRGNYEEVIRSGRQQQKQFAKKERGEYEYAELLYRMGKAHYGLGDYSEAIGCFEQGIGILKRLGGNNYSDMARYADRIVAIYFSQEDFNTAYDHADISLTYVNKALSRAMSELERDKKVINSSPTPQQLDAVIAKMARQGEAIDRDMIIVARQLTMMGYSIADYTSALETCMDAVGPIREYSGECSFEYIEIATLAGSICESLSDFEQAGRWYGEGIELSQKLDGAGSVRANILRRMGNMYLKLGNYSKALASYEQSRSVYADAGMTGHPDYAQLLYDMGSFYTAAQELPKALSHTEQALAIQQKRFKEPHIKCIRTRIGIASILKAMGEYEKAEAHYDACMDSKVILDFPEDFVTLCQGFADIFMFHNQYQGAADMLNSALELLEVRTENDNQLLRPVLNGLGYAYLQLKDYDKAFVYYSRLLEVEKKMVCDVFAFLPEAERAHYWAESYKYINGVFRTNRQGTVSGLRGIVYSSIQQGNAVSAPLLYNASLLNKGLLLETTVRMAQIIEESGDQALRKQFDRLQQLRRQLMKIDETHTPMPPEEVAELRKEAEALESTVISKSRQYGDFMKFAGIEWQDVRDALSEGETAVEFVCSTDKGTAYYSAEFLQKGFEAPKHLFLFALTQNEREALMKGSVYDDNKLYGKVWSRLKPYLHERETIYFAPTGDLYNIGIEYLLIDGSVRMCEQYNMIRLSSTRELVREETAPKSSAAALFGGLNYNTDVADMSFYASNNAVRGQRGRFETAGELRSAVWSYLKGTRQEVEEIEPCLSKNGYNAAKFTGDEGVEEAFKALSGDKTDLIHIATHGFYLPEESSENGAELQRIPEEDRALLRSGLVFAGANNAWAGDSEIPDDIDDGILSAKEISLLDLRGTDMLVMSACQTGLGVVGSDGVFGLQRAFKKAGVQTLVMSLWEVSDEATKVMMVEFYKALMAGNPKRQAFRLAQEKVMAGAFMMNGKKESGANPYFWASFIMVD